MKSCRRLYQNTIYIDLSILPRLSLTLGIDPLDAKGQRCWARRRLFTSDMSLRRAKVPSPAPGFVASQRTGLDSPAAGAGSRLGPCSSTNPGPEGAPIGRPACVGALGRLRAARTASRRPSAPWRE